MAEIWLSYNNKAEEFQLPVNPPELVVGNGSQNESVSVHRLGEATIIQDPVLKTFTFSSFFPQEFGPYCEVTEGELKEPWHYVEILERWKNTGWPIRFIVTSSPINFPVTIENFTYRERGGDVGTLYFDLSLKEYKFIKVRTIEEKKDPATGQKTVTTSNKGQRPNEKAPAKTYTVKSGDNLYNIAMKELKDATKYKTIASLNGIRPPYTIKPGQVLKLP